MSGLMSLVLKGSPAAAGNSLRLAAEVLDAVGGDRRIIDLYRSPVLPCRACARCADGNDCPLADGMAEIMGALAAADVLLIASPLHFTSLSAPLIAFISRLQPFWHARRRGAPPLPPRNRQGGLVLTAGSRYPDMFKPARSVAAAAFKSLAIPFVGMATADNTDTLPVVENAAALAAAHDLGTEIRRRLV